MMNITNSVKKHGKITKTYGCTVQGVDGTLITIEVNIVNGTKLMMVGLPDNAIKESQHRIESVLKSEQYHMPRKRVIVNLAPASLRKEGAYYDLPIALAILNASHQINVPNLHEYMIMGELSLDGYLRPIRGALPMAIQGRKMGLKGFLLPQKNAEEAGIVNNLPIIPITHIKEAIAFLDGTEKINPIAIDTRKLFSISKNKFPLDFQDIKGQETAKRAAEVAASGGHNMLMIGPPGAGKTMLAKRIPSILPPLTLHEALSTTKIYSVAGKLSSESPIVTQRPFRSPHHTISDVALVGGGTIPQPGEISMAHNGLLFMDELPEFKRSTLEVLRQPLEEKRIEITRARFALSFPANFMLVASMNPCPCGYYTHPEKKCHCTPQIRHRYLNKISGPLLDRIDIHLSLMPVNIDKMTEVPSGYRSERIKARVVNARARQVERFVRYPQIFSNAMMPAPLVKKICHLSNSCKKLIKGAMDTLDLSARAYDRILKVARTIADIEGAEEIERVHLSEAIHYRSLDRSSWAG